MMVTISIVVVVPRVTTYFRNCSRGLKTSTISGLSVACDPTEVPVKSAYEPPDVSHC